MATLRAVVVVAVLVASSAVCGLPYWRLHPWWAAMTICCCAGFGVAGVLMQTESRTRTCGTMLVLAGAAWSLTWAQSWNAGVLPVFGQFSQSLSFLALAMAILRYVRPGKLGALERWWVAAGVVVLLIGTGVQIAISDPSWMGYRAGVLWPHFTMEYGFFAGYIRLLGILFIALAVGFGFVVYRQARRSLPRKYRLLEGPLLALMVAGGLVASWTEQVPAMTNFETQLQVFGYQGLLGVGVVLALSYTGLADRFAWLRVRDQLIARASPPSMRGFRDAAADALDDPPLEVYYRIPGSDSYIDSQGQWAGKFRGGAWEGTVGGRWLCRVFSDTGALTAVIDLDLRLREREGLMAVVRSVAGLLIMHSDLRDEIRAAGLQLQHQSQLDLIQAGISERRELERNLHDGAQQMLIALSMKMAAAAITDSAAQDLVTGWRKDLRKATDELRNLARGIYPAALTDGGLLAAFESMAERQTEIYVDLDVPDSRFPQVIETSLYFAVSEAVTNAAKHSGAPTVRVRVEHKPPLLTCGVSDDGSGLAEVTPDGGVQGIINRIQMLGGDAWIKAAPGKGTSIEMVVPCE